jgi:hypothetical protein
MKMTLIIYFLLLFNLAKAQHFIQVIAGKTAFSSDPVPDSNVPDIHVPDFHIPDSNVPVTNTSAAGTEFQFSPLSMTRGIHVAAVATGTVFMAVKGVYAAIDGKIYICDSGASQIKVVDTAGIITTFAGAGVPESG